MYKRQVTDADIPARDWRIFAVGTQTDGNPPLRVVTVASSASPSEFDIFAAGTTATVTITATNGTIRQAPTEVSAVQAGNTSIAVGTGTPSPAYPNATSIVYNITGIDTSLTNDIVFDASVVARSTGAETNHSPFTETARISVVDNRAIRVGGPTSFSLASTTDPVFPLSSTNYTISTANVMYRLTRGGSDVLSARAIPSVNDITFGRVQLTEGTDYTVEITEATDSRGTDLSGSELGEHIFSVFAPYIYGWATSDSVTTLAGLTGRTDSTTGIGASRQSVNFPRLTNPLSSCLLYTSPSPRD